MGESAGTGKFAPALALTPPPDGVKVAHVGNLAPAEAELLTTAQVNELYGWSITSINRWAASGELRSERKLPGLTGPRLFARSVVEDFRRTRETAA